MGGQLRIDGPLPRQPLLGAPVHAGKTVEVAADGGQILVRAGDTIIAEPAINHEPDT